MLTVDNFEQYMLCTKVLTLSKIVYYINELHKLGVSAEDIKGIIDWAVEIIEDNLIYDEITDLEEGSECWNRSKYKIWLLKSINVNHIYFKIY